MTDLFKATKTAFEADATLTAVGTLHNTIIPPNTALPYARQFAVSPASTTHFFGDHHIERNRIQFSIFHTSLVTLTTYYEALRTLFDQTTKLTLDSGAMLGAQLGTAICPSPAIGQTKDGLPIYHAWVEYIFLIDRAN